MLERDFDELLKIETSGDQKGFNQSFHYHRYESTPYSALDILFKQYELKSTDRLVDFGCGKGRLNFFINYLFHSTAVGVEMNEGYYAEAIENRQRYVKKFKNRKDDIHFHCCLAEEYKIDPADNRFYFFNPFSIQIFMKIINNILLSVEKFEREIELILYYPSKDYTYFLENQTAFELKSEVLLPESKHNPNERFLIYHYSLG
ncbi:methyltransferase [Bacillus sp. DTU_2020_1000418_1_SI_GHA_SEK_038]|uniref:methyltransferase n=1 Tax=Bacillus sp. DTU_2020_1000418_1_SI_GHA_SEK_038 TaxID=3077585 RepID=UPI0028E4A7B7|nr:methyltransferase [Bacillus sp. DTU_2020_1000418_1_SI_GHA_SEK_038]WNS76103.1 methyltransferase [Bacillus sp. DTU_2020_1000418_1_SI_GHA_SEK_038]